MKSEVARFDRPPGQPCPDDELCAGWRCGGEEQERDGPRRREAWGG